MIPHMQSKGTGRPSHTAGGSNKNTGKMIAEEGVAFISCLDNFYWCQGFAGGSTKFGEPPGSPGSDALHLLQLIFRPGQQLVKFLLFAQFLQLRIIRFFINTPAAEGILYNRDDLLFNYGNLAAIDGEAFTSFGRFKGLSF
jgi:hypothetical protein